MQFETLFSQIFFNFSLFYFLVLKKKSLKIQTTQINYDFIYCYHSKLHSLLFLAQFCDCLFIIILTVKLIIHWIELVRIKVVIAKGGKV